MRLLALVARTQLRGSLVWLLIVGALTTATAGAYAGTYATETQRAAAVLHAQHDAASLLLYGPLPDPGTSAQMFVWEVGSYTSILVAVAAVMLAVRTTRAAEAAGTAEIVRTTGRHRQALLWTAVAWLAVIGAGLGVAAAGGLWLRRDALDGFDSPGALAYGATVGATFVLTGLATIVIGEVLPTATATYRAAAVFLGAAFGLRAWGSLDGHPAAAAVSPLGLRGVVRPFTDDHLLPLVAATLVAAALAAVAATLEARREPGSGLLHPPAIASKRLRVATPVGLDARLQLAGVGVWAAGVAAAAALLTTMGSGVVASARDGGIDGGFLAEQLQGTDPASAYLGYVAHIIGITVAVCAVLAVQAAAGDERRGLTEHVRATGTRRWAPLGSRALVSATGSLLVLALAAAAAAPLAPDALGEQVTALDATRGMLGQWPAAALLTGAATFVVGTRPRWATLAWLPLGLSIFLTMLGGLLGLPDGLMRLSAFAHAPSTWQLPDLGAAGLLLLTGVVLALGGLVAVAHRDEVSG